MKLKKGRYLPSSHLEKLIWFRTFKTKLADIAEKLSISPTEMSAVEKDFLAYEYIVTMVEIFKLGSKERTSFRELLAYDKSNITISRMPQLPNFPEEPEVVPPGIFTRLAKLVQRIKYHPKYNEAIGKGLGIIGPEKVIELEKLIPRIKVKTTSNTGITLGFIKGSMEGVIIFSGTIHNDDENSTEVNFEWNEIGRVTRSPFIDDRPNKVQKPETRYYRARYFKNDTMVGDNSSIIKVVAEVYGTE